MHTNFEKVIIALILIYFKDADALFFHTKFGVFDIILVDQHLHRFSLVDGYF